MRKSHQPLINCRDIMVGLCEKRKHKNKEDIDQYHEDTSQQRQHNISIDTQRIVSNSFLFLLYRSMEEETKKQKKRLKKATKAFKAACDCWYAQDYEDALRLFQECLQVREALLGKNHPQTAQAYYSMGCSLHGQGKYEDALIALRRTMRIATAIDDIPRQRSVKDYIQWVLQKGYGQSGHQLKVYQQELEDSIQWEQTGDAAVQEEEEDHTEMAVEAYEQSLAIEISAAGSTHLDIADLFVKLASLTRNDGHWEKAASIYEVILGTDHPVTISAANKTKPGLPSPPTTKKTSKEPSTADQASIITIEDKECDSSVVPSLLETSATDGGIITSTETTKNSTVPNPTANNNVATAPVDTCTTTTTLDENGTQPMGSSKPIRMTSSQEKTTDTVIHDLKSVEDTNDVETGEQEAEATMGISEQATAVTIDTGEEVHRAEDSATIGDEAIKSDNTGTFENDGSSSSSAMHSTTPLQQEQEQIDRTTEMSINDSEQDEQEEEGGALTDKDTIPTTLNETVTISTTIDVSSQQQRQQQRQSLEPLDTTSGKNLMNPEAAETLERTTTNHPNDAVASTDDSTSLVPQPTNVEESTSAITVKGELNAIDDTAPAKSVKDEQYTTSMDDTDTTTTDGADSLVEDDETTSPMNQEQEVVLAAAVTQDPSATGSQEVTTVDDSSTSTSSRENQGVLVATAIVEGKPPSNDDDDSVALQIDDCIGSQGNTDAIAQEDAARSAQDVVESSSVASQEVDPAATDDEVKDDLPTPAPPTKKKKKKNKSAGEEDATEDKDEESGNGKAGKKKKKKSSKKQDTPENHDDDVEDKPKKKKKKKKQALVAGVEEVPNAGDEDVSPSQKEKKSKKKKGQIHPDEEALDAVPVVKAKKKTKEKNDKKNKKKDTATEPPTNPAVGSSQQETKKKDDTGKKNRGWGLFSNRSKQ